MTANTLEPTGKTKDRGIQIPIKCDRCKRESVTTDPIGRGWIVNAETGRVLCVSCVHDDLG